MRTAALRKQHSADAGTDGTFPPSFVSSLPLPTPCISLSPFASFFLRHPRGHRRRWQRAEPTRCVGCVPRVHHLLTPSPLLLLRFPTPCSSVTLFTQLRPLLLCRTPPDSHRRCCCYSWFPSPSSAPITI